MERKSSFLPRFGFAGCARRAGVDGGLRVRRSRGPARHQRASRRQRADPRVAVGQARTRVASNRALAVAERAQCSRRPRYQRKTSCSTPGSPGPRVVRRLSAGEFAASIADLFGDKAAPVAQVFNDSRVLGFTVDSNTLQVQDLNADQLMSNAEAVASWAVSTKLTQLTQLATCSTLDDNCATLFVKNFGRKAFRTAFAEADSRIESYRKLFMAEASFADGVSSVISAMLQSPYFLYRSELGAVGC